MKKKEGAFGVVYQDIMRSELQPESKALYAYLASFAGNENTCYPTISRICNEMHMGKSRVNKYMKELQKFGVIKKQRKRNGNLLGNTVYTLTHDISISEQSKNEKNNCFRTIENRTIENRTIENRTVENEYTNNNIFNNNNINNNRNKNSVLDGTILEPSEDDEGMDPDEAYRIWKEQQDTNRDHQNNERL